MSMERVKRNIAPITGIGGGLLACALSFYATESLTDNWADELHSEAEASREIAEYLVGLESPTGTVDIFDPGRLVGSPNTRDITDEVKGVITDRAERLAETGDHSPTFTSLADEFQGDSLAYQSMSTQEQITSYEISSFAGMSAFAITFFVSMESLDRRRRR